MLKINAILSKSDEEKDFVRKFIGENVYNMKIEDFKQRVDYLYNVEPIKSISYGYIPNFIKSVMLNPFAPNWFDKTVEQFCAKNEIKYLGKSKLYDE